MDDGMQSKCAALPVYLRSCAPFAAYLEHWQRASVCVHQHVKRGAVAAQGVKAHVTPPT